MKPEHPRPHIFESLSRVERWWRTIDRVQGLETDPAEIQWQRFADDARYIRETLIETLHYLSTVDGLKGSQSSESCMPTAAIENEPAQAAEGIEYYSQVWRELPRVEEWVKSVQGVLDSEDSEVLMGVTKDSVPIVVSALGDAAELLDYLRSFIERQG
jgi:hypothetical protein